MRTIPASLASHLASGTTRLCRCWRLSRRDGAVFGFTDHDRDLAFGGVTYAAASGLAPSEAERQLGLAVSSGEISGALTAAAITEADIANGLYDDAEVQTWLVNWSDVSQRLLLASASIGEIRRSEHGFTAELRGPMHRYDQPRGRLYQAHCDADLGDGRCRVDLDPMARSGAIATVDGRIGFTLPAVGGLTAGWFTGGTASVLTGANAGHRRMIQSHAAGGVISLWQPFLAPLAPGDQVRLVPGCDKRFATCTSKFDNALNFRGFPHLPSPDFVLSYARSGEAGHDGGTLDP